jgi:hypothetical protein
VQRNADDRRVEDNGHGAHDEDQGDLEHLRVDLVGLLVGHDTT